MNYESWIMILPLDPAWIGVVFSSHFLNGKKLSVSGSHTRENSLIDASYFLYSWFSVWQAMDEYSGSLIFISDTTVRFFWEEIVVRSFDFLDIEPKEQRSHYQYEFVVFPCRFKVKMQSVLCGSCDAATGAVDIGYQFWNAYCRACIKEIGR